MALAPRALYPKAPECLYIPLDLRYPGAEERLQRELDAWLNHAYVEQLTAEASVLIVQAGAATELAS